MTRIGALFLALIAFVSLATACGSGQSQEEIATEVASAWVDDSIEDVSKAAVELVVGDSLVLSQIAGDVLAEQVHNNVVWLFSSPSREGEDRYQLTATASVTLSVEVPLLGTKSYVASMPFILDVDTKSKTVERWSLDAFSATVEEQG